MEKTETDDMIDLGVEALQKGRIDQARTFFFRFFKETVTIQTATII